MTPLERCLPTERECLMRLGPREEAFVISNKVARMATVSEDGEPHVIPVCYAYDGEFFYTAIDEKPKKVRPERLKRIRNIAANSRVAFLVDVYDEDWSRLAYVLIRGDATFVEDREERDRATQLLRERYEQYVDMDLTDPRRPIVKIAPTRLTAWGDF